MPDMMPYRELSTFDTASVICSSTVENTRVSICDHMLSRFPPSAVAENAFVQGTIASYIPDMDAQVKLQFPTANLTLLLSKSSLRGVRETTYSLEHDDMRAEVTFPETFKPIRLNVFMDAITSGDIKSIYSLPSMEDDDVFVVALAISHGNSSAPMHLSPVEAVPQVSSIALHVNSTGGLEPVIAHNLKFPPKPFISVTLTTAEITDKHIAERVDHAYGSPKCSRLDMEKGVYTRTGMAGDDSFTEKSSNPTRYTIQCESDRLEIFDHSKITMLYQEPISWATLIYASSVIGIGLFVLVIMIATDANAICAGRPKVFQPIDLSQRGTLFSELMKNHLWLGLLTGIGDNFKSTTIRNPTTGQKILLPPEWSVRKYQALMIWTSSLISYSVGAMALVSSLRSPTYFPLDENPTKYLLQDYWLACLMCAIACGKGVHIILDLIFSRFQYTFATIQVNSDDVKQKKKGSDTFSIFDALESIILGRYFPLPLNLIPMTFCALFIAGMCFVTIYLGLEYDWQATYLWTIGTIAAVLIDVIVLDPAYIGMRAFVLSFFQAAKIREHGQKDDLVEEEETIADIHEDTVPEKGEGQSYQAPGDSIKRTSTTDSKPTAQSDISSEEKPEKSHVRDGWLVWALTLFTWEFMTPMVFKGITRPLEIEDLQPTSIYDHSNTLTTRFMLVWGPMSQKIKNGAVLIRAMVAVFGSHFFLATLLRFAADALTVVSPLIMMELIKCLVDLSRDPLPGYLLILAMFLGNFLSASFQNQAFDVSTRLGMNVRSTLASSVYRKSLVLSNKARQTRSTGQIVNLMSIDAEKFQMVMPFLPWVITSFLQIAVSLGFLFYYLKYAAFLSIGIMLALIPLNIVLMGFFQTMRKRVLLNTDKRVKAVNEMLQSIRIVKFFAWEDSFTTEIGRIRRYELIQFVGLAVCKAILGVVLNGAPIIISVGTFGLFAAIYGQEKLTPDLVFPSMAYLNILRFPMTFMPMLLAMTIDLSVSLGRVGSFLQEEELQKDAIATVVDNADDLENSIVIENGCFEWEVPDEKVDKKTRKQKQKEKRMAKKLSKDIGHQQSQQDKLQQQVEIELQEEVVPSSAENEPVVSHDVGKLIDIDLKIQKGSLTVIVGTVGSGKSSLLCSLIGDMKKTQGSITLAGSIAYCTQSAWIVNDTVRGNITFGKPYDQDKYDEIIKVCALETDLEILTGGDQTEIGEKGVNLSGGQRQRISLARAVYSDADIYLLDDPLSAVDAHVGKHLFDKCITERLKTKTRVLVTHQIQHIHKADYVVVMDQGRIVEQGTFNELMNYGPDGYLVEMMKELREHEQEEEEETIAELGMDENKHTSDALALEAQIDDKTDDVTMDKLQAEAKEAQTALMTLEERTTGRLSFKNIMFYVMASGGPIIASIVMVLYAVAQAGILMTDWWLTQWTSNKYSYLNLGQYFGIYIGIGAISMVLVFFRDTIFSFLGVLGSKRLHERMLKRVIRAPSSFFDTTPIGRILNRFSKDMESVDQMLGTMLTQFFSTALQTIGNCVLMIIAMYWLSIPLAIFSVIYLIIQQIYTSTFRELKRIDAISRSPVYSHFSESLTGLSSIRAYGRQQDFIDKFDERLDINVGAFRMQNDVQRWLSFRLDVLGSLCTLAVGIMAMVMRDSDTVDPSMMSLALTYSLSMTMMLSFMVRNATEAEAAFASVERIAYYVANVPIEPPAVIPDSRPPQEWPQKGEIVFENVDARYRPELPLVIKDVSMSIRSNEKIGVVGRTGSGKSTIMLLLFRMFDVAAGRIVIDGININDIGLDDLRNKIAIIPQEATLFTGTVRSNLDPFSNYTDKFLWEALEKAHLKETIEKLEKGLDAPVSENGENFSVGQRQLICLARALCKQSKILILDEASASLDFATDALIQKTVREAFADCTRLTIAHRLNTIIDSDRVLVLDQGRIMEFDSPKNLFLNHPEGIFSSLVNETGQANAALLRSIALGEIAFDSALEEMQKLQEQEQMKEQGLQEREQDKATVEDKDELKEEIPQLQGEGEVKEEEQEQNEEAAEEPKEEEKKEDSHQMQDTPEVKEQQEQQQESLKAEQEEGSKNSDDPDTP